MREYDGGGDVSPPPTWIAAVDGCDESTDMCGYGAGDVSLPPTGIAAVDCCDELMEICGYGAGDVWSTPTGIAAVDGCDIEMEIWGKGAGDVSSATEGIGYDTATKIYGEELGSVVSVPKGIAALDSYDARKEIYIAALDTHDARKEIYREAAIPLSMQDGKSAQVLSHGEILAGVNECRKHKHLGTQESRRGAEFGKQVIQELWTNLRKAKNTNKESKRRKTKVGRNQHLETRESQGGDEFCKQHLETRESQRGDEFAKRSQSIEQLWTNLRKALNAKNANKERKRMKTKARQQKRKAGIVDKVDIPTAKKPTLYHKDNMRNMSSATFQIVNAVNKIVR